MYDQNTPSNKVPIWAYWEGPKPPWIALCHEIMKERIPMFTLLSKKDFKDWWFRSEHHPSTWEIQYPNVQSDFIRAHQLNYYGGIWLDSDCIMFKDISPIWNMLLDHPFIAYRVLEPKQQLCSALLASYAGSKVAKQYFHIMNKKLLKQPNKPLNKIALGPNVLHRARKVTGLSLGFIPTELVHPIHWGYMKQLWKKRSDKEHSLVYNYPDAYCFMLTHRSIGPHKNHSKKQILNGRTVISYMFRQALGLKDPHDKRTLQTST